MSNQPTAVLAFILVHEINHAEYPWTEYGQDCFRGELMADMSAVLWWQGKYGDAGHPDTGNEFIRFFNYELSLWVQDVRDGTRTWFTHIREKHADFCRYTGPVAPTPTPRPTPALPTGTGVYDQAQNQRGCQFVRGFKTLRDLIGHHIVGECLENEHYNAIGDSNQHTTGGLLAWRKADNWTAFTDGYRTWINGPNGLVQRLNTERFEWEATPAPTPAPSTETDVYNQERVDLLFRIPDAFARAAWAEIHGVNEHGGTTRRFMRYFANQVQAMPAIYIMHVWATGGMDSGHPLLDVDRFAVAYLRDFKHYTDVVGQWLDGLEANPCSASAAERAWIIKQETYRAGILRAYMALALSAGQTYGVQSALEDAAAELLRNPNTIAERYGCDG